MVRKSVFKEVELKRISPNRLNPRLEFRKETLDELAESIEEVGLVQPLILRPKNGNYEVVVGERRYRASQQAKLDKVPAIIKDYEDDEVIQLNLIENIQRDELSDVEKGNCCNDLKTQYPTKHPTNEELAKRLGVAAGTIQRWIQVATDVPKEIQTMVTPVEKRGTLIPKGKITSDIALQITRGIKEPKKRTEVAKELARKPIPVRIARKVVKEISRKPQRPTKDIIKKVLEKEESKIVTETDTEELLTCPICDMKLRLIHREPEGHKLEEVFE